MKKTKIIASVSDIYPIINKEKLGQLFQIGFWSFKKNGKNNFTQEVLILLSLPGSFPTIENFSSTIISEDMEDFKNSPLYKTVTHWDHYIENKRFDFEFRIKKSTGIRYIHGRGVIHSGNKKDDLTVEGYLEDVTEYKMEERKKFEHLSRMALLGEAASNIVHEINTPLTAISFYANYLLKNLNEKKIVDEKFQDKLKIIDKITKQMSKMVGSMKTFMRPEDRRVYEKKDLNQIIKDSLELCEERLSWAQVKIDVDIPEEILLTCRPYQICQILTNLIMNSIQSIRVKNERWIKISAHHKNGWAFIEILDSGSGIDPEIARNIMRPYFTTKFQDGTGLGLFIAKELTEQHGGKIYYDPSSRYTLFIVELPLEQDPVKSSE
jgi:signal transduction histidine kinase